jgi:hypothetical protein
VIHRGDYVGEAVAGARAGSEDVVAVVSGDADRLGLVAVEPEGFASVVRTFP